MFGESVRRPAVAGSFYPGSAGALKREVEACLAAVPETHIEGTAVAALAPHAGYRYSAPVAAHVYKVMGGLDVDTVVIIGHDAHAHGLIAILSDADAFDTPLGKVPVDTELVAALVKAHKGIIVHNGVHGRDHTVEVHLPFLHTVLPQARIVPVLFGDPTPQNCRDFADTLTAAAGTRRLFVLASTDLTHYPSSEDSRAIDQQTMARVQALDVEGLFRHLEQMEASGAARNVQTAMCASGGVGTAMLYARSRGAGSAVVLRRANSGDIPGGDPDRVVGYAAAVFVAPAAQAGDEAAATPEFRLPESTQRELLRLARERIRRACRQEPFEYEPPGEQKQVLERPGAVFVTLHSKGRLRGCIGMTEARLELWRAVYEMAHSAAFRDRRFSPVKTEELDDLHIEISVLSPLQPVSGADEVVPKRHGVVVRQGARSGLFLPQVWEQIPDKERFLSVLCAEKAGLPGDAWKHDNTRLLVFTVFAFEEPRKP